MLSGQSHRRRRTAGLLLLATCWCWDQLVLLGGVAGRLLVVFAGSAIRSNGAKAKPLFGAGVQLPPLV